jgi:hypothetical protein
MLESLANELSVESFSWCSGAKKINDDYVRVWNFRNVNETI